MTKTEVLRSLAKIEKRLETQDGLLNYSEERDDVGIVVEYIMSTDLTARTCENCKHAQNTTVSDMENGYLDCNKLYVEGFLEQGFGCSLFERKDKQSQQIVAGE